MFFLFKFLFLFTVYPSGSMLEMSNGYPNSASPLGSPSPGPSPGIGGHHNKRKILTILKLPNL